VVEALLEWLPEDVVRLVRIARDATLMGAVTAMTTGRATLAESVENTTGVARLLLSRPWPVA
jgi:hypothetical protein